MTSVLCKPILAVAMCALSILPLLASPKEGQNGPHPLLYPHPPTPSVFKIGPKVAYDFFSAQLPLASKPARGMEDLGYGITAGMAMRNEWYRKWYIESGMLFTYGHSPLQIANGNSGFSDFDLERAAIVIPLHLGFKFDVINQHGLSFFIGGWGSYGLGGRLDSSGDQSPFTLYGEQGVWNRWSAGVAFGFTIEVSEHVSFDFDGHLGLTKMGKKDIFVIDRVNESSARVGISWWVPRNKKHPRHQTPRGGLSFPEFDPDD